MNTNTFPLHKARAIISLDRESTYFALTADGPVTLTGSVMLGFLVDSTVLFDFKKAW